MVAQNQISLQFLNIGPSCQVLQQEMSLATAFPLDGCRLSSVSTDVAPSVADGLKNRPSASDAFRLTILPTTRATAILPGHL